MTPYRDEAGYRSGVPPFVDAYNRILGVVERSQLQPGDLIPGEVALADELAVDREVVQEALLLLGEDGELQRDRGRRWRVAPAVTSHVGFAGSFHRMLGPDVHPARRLHAAVEDVSRWSGRLLQTDEQCLCWETVFEQDGVVLAATLEFLRLSHVPPELLDDLDAAGHQVAARPTLLDVIDTESLTPTTWRLAPVSRNTERLGWMELPLHGIPVSLTVVLSQSDQPVYLAKNIFDLGTFNLDVAEQP